MSKCKECEYFISKYLECECPDVPQSKAEFYSCSPDDKACEYFEQNRSEQE